ncbi:hypothetical protein DA83_20985 [Pseudomonas sp. 250J]|uniref:hypothetical protein n=1 Tax=Pseudomonas TaxID=286 RepID=UPI0006833F23|nr:MULTISPECIES: hypothetical protein [Pseudomonas]KNX78759.1 hypothetical protein DA83_20985 [Pseudomonas sp. 250J]MCU7280686.1 hypothetical protein [Pseudomonas peradeniyensis]QZA52933.1 hypothetical protein K2O50_18225 [Pseudomonas sp. 2hn]
MLGELGAINLSIACQRDPPPGFAEFVSQTYAISSRFLLAHLAITPLLRGTDDGLGIYTSKPTYSIALTAPAPISYQFCTKLLPNDPELCPRRFIFFPANIISLIEAPSFFAIL